MPPIEGHERLLSIGLSTAGSSERIFWYLAGKPMAPDPRAHVIMPDNGWANVSYNVPPGETAFIWVVTDSANSITRWNQATRDDAHALIVDLELRADGETLRMAGADVAGRDRDVRVGMSNVMISEDLPLGSVVVGAGLTLGYQRTAGPSGVVLTGTFGRAGMTGEDTARIVVFATADATITQSMAPFLTGSATLLGTDVGVLTTGARVGSSTSNIAGETGVLLAGVDIPIASSATITFSTPTGVSMEQRSGPQSVLYARSGACAGQWSISASGTTAPSAPRVGTAFAEGLTLSAFAGKVLSVPPTCT